MKQHSPIRVAALGMEQRVYQSLRLFFQGQCKDSYELVEEHAADICIIDLDSYRSDAVLEQQRRQHPDRPAIVISVSDINSEDVVFVRKPLQIASLTKALNEAQASIAYMKAANSSQQFYVGEVTEAKKQILPVENPIQNNKQPEKVEFYKEKTKDIPQIVPSTKAEPALDSLPNADESGIMYVTNASMVFNSENRDLMDAIQYRPHDLLQGYVQQAYHEAIKHERNVILEGPWRPLTIYYRTNEMGVNKNIKHLYALSLLRIDPKAVTITVLSDKETSETKKPNGSSEPELRMPMEQFLWKLALRTSKGRVPAGTNFYAPVKLTRWPNLSRNAITPHAFRIAALWVKHPMSLLHTADVLNISLRYVFVFYSAALAANLIEQDTTVDRNELFKPKLTVHSQRNIFKLIINRLRGI